MASTPSRQSGPRAQGNSSFGLRARAGFGGTKKPGRNSNHTLHARADEASSAATPAGEAGCGSSCFRREIYIHRRALEVIGQHQRAGLQAGQARQEAIGD